MSRAEAIRRFEKQLTEAMVVLDSGFGTRPGENDLLYRKRKEMAEIALQALREQEEREDPKPLTIEELREMNGLPVWVEELSKLIDNTGWALVDVDDRGTWKGVPFVKCHVCTWNVVSRNLHCYRHKPKEG